MTLPARCESSNTASGSALHSSAMRESMAGVAPDTSNKKPARNTRAPLTCGTTGVTYTATIFSTRESCGRSANSS